jgi:hypothetical protein
VNDSSQDLPESLSQRDIMAVMKGHLSAGSKDKGKSQG